MTGSEMDFEEMVLAVAGSALESAGVVVRVLRTDAGYGLHDEAAGANLFLDNVTERARRAGPEWRAVVTEWVEGFLALRAQRDRVPSEDEIRSQIRVRLLPAGDERTYAREFASGLVVALAIDTPTAVETHTDRSLADSAIPVDELYRLGQANTDAEPIDEVFHVEDDIYGLTGDSWFVASRVTNVASLLPVIGPAPLGVLFAPLNRSVVLYTIVKGGNEWMGQVAALALRVDALVSDEEIEHPGGVLSDATFYWAPDGRVEYMARCSMVVDGEPTITVSPGDAFGDVVLGGKAR